jgi:hypothetical protein
MSLPVRQQRVLDQMEATLQSADPRLLGMFSIFTRLTARDTMPATEAIRTRTRTPPVLVPVAMMAVTVLASVLVAVLAGTPRCARLPGIGGSHVPAQAAACAAAGGPARSPARSPATR